jgi:alpha-D-ribose 1-methylphosphonate 5-triphosphate synthase subunit PhnH
MTVPVLTPRSAREQQSFRALLDGMARPGSVHHAPVHPQGERLGAAMSLLESVLDHEVTFAVLPPRADVTETLLRLTGSRVAAPEAADYLLGEGEGITAALRAAKSGTPEFPDRSGTVFAAVASVVAVGGAGDPMTLTGPGIDGSITVCVAGLPVGALDAFDEANADPPMGVDLVLVAPDGAFACLCRYSRLVRE